MQYGLVHHCSLTYKKKHIIKSSRTGATPGAVAMPEWLFAFLSPRRVTFSRVSLVSCSLTSLWCSKVCSTSILGSVLKWKGSHHLPKRRKCHTWSAVTGKSDVVNYGLMLYVLLLSWAGLLVSARHFSGWLQLFKCNNGSPVLHGNNIGIRSWFANK